VTDTRQQATKDDCRQGDAATSEIFDKIDGLMARGKVTDARVVLEKLRTIVHQMWSDAEAFAPESRP
jgi:hypothetical protein